MAQKRKETSGLDLDADDDDDTVEPDPTVDIGALASQSHVLQFLTSATQVKSIPKFYSDKKFM